METFLRLVICTRNRSNMLRKALASVVAARPMSLPMKVVVVDNASEDDTRQAIEEFAAVQYVRCEAIGLGNARNAGINSGAARWYAFTDDDCYLDPGYFEGFERATQNAEFHYGVGQILLFDPEADKRIANLEIHRLVRIPPDSYIPPGAIQGANLFFKHEVFEKVGMFNPLMGSGTLFPCEDLDMAARASLAGFVGAQVPDFTVLHDHGIKAGSIAAEVKMRDYAYGRGAYFASLLHTGVSDPWMEWHRRAVAEYPWVRHMYQRELEGATTYLSSIGRRTDQGSAPVGSGLGAERR